MNGLSPEAAALLNRTRDLDAPPAGAKERVRAAMEPALRNGPSTASPRNAKLSLWWVLGSILVLSAAGILLVGMNRLKTAPGTSPEMARKTHAVSFTMPTAIPDLRSVADFRSDPIPEPPARVLKEGNPGSTLQAELALLRAAQAARNAGNPRDAAAILRTHRERFPDGILRAEREAARVLVECDLGHRDSAEEIARTFVRRYPTSPLIPAVNRSCAGQMGGSP